MNHDDFTTAALKYAKRRWCWEDEAFIKELIDDNKAFIEGARPTPQGFIDEAAKKYNLIDPRRDW